MDGERSLTDTELRLVGVLGARSGSASPRELRETTRVPPRTLTRALGHLDKAGLLAERTKSVVRLSAGAWQLLDRPQATQRPVPRTTFRARVDDRQSGAPTLRSEPSEGSKPEEPSENPNGAAQDDDSGGFFKGLLEGLSRDV
jgi:hypothetical protein